MSKPLDYDNKLRGALSEICSGNSALNMPADPIPQAEVEKDTGKKYLSGEVIFLSESDRMVKHAMEHFHKAFEMLAEYEVQSRGKYIGQRDWLRVLTVIESLAAQVSLDVCKDALDILPEDVRKELAI